MEASSTSRRLMPMPLRNFFSLIRCVLTTTITEARTQRPEIWKTMKDILELMDTLRDFVHLQGDYVAFTERLLRRTRDLHNLFRTFDVPHFAMTPVLALFDRPVRVLILQEYLEKYFNVTSELGKGDYGTVYKVQERASGREYAMKKVERKLSDMDGIVKAKKEVLNMRKLIQHENIVKCHFAWIQTGFYSDFSNPLNPWKDLEENMVSMLYIQMELCKQSLATWLATRNRHLEECTKPDVKVVLDSLEIFEQIAEAVSYMHAVLYYHGDIKTANILMDERGVPKVSDFGLTSLHKEWKSGRFERDIQDLGQVLVELLCPFHSTKKCDEEMAEIDRCADMVKISHEMLVKIDRNEEMLNIRSEDMCSALKACPENMRGLILCMRNGNEKKRLTADQLVPQLRIMSSQQAAEDPKYRKDS